MTGDPETSRRPFHIDLPPVPAQELSGCLFNVGKSGGGQNLVQPGFPILRGIGYRLNGAGRTGVQEQEPQQHVNAAANHGPVEVEALTEPMRGRSQMSAHERPAKGLIFASQEELALRER